jgi:serine protease AprX
VSTVHRSIRGRTALAVSLVLSLGVTGTASSVEAKNDRHDTTTRSDAKPAKGHQKEADTTTEGPAEEPATADTSDAVTTDSVATGWHGNHLYDRASLLDASLLLADDDGITSLAEVVRQIGADDLWAAGYTGAGVDVAIIDTGVAPVAGLADTNVVIGPDLSFEGFVDEVAGLDTYGHGTHLAGIIAGRSAGADPSSPQPGDFLGVAPDARLVSVKVADNTGAVDVSQVIAAVDWVVKNRQRHGLDIRVLNLSYNTTGQQSYLLDPLSKAIENAWNHGIVVVTSAGNEGFTSFGLASPATNPRVLAVSSAERTEYGWVNPRWAPSGDGTRNPDVLAPGVSIESLRVPGSRVDVEHPTARVGDDRFLGSGTSQSAAVVSGAAALLLQQRPYLSPDDVKHLLTETAMETWQFEIIKGDGAIDLAKAMNTEFEAVFQATEPATGLGSLEAARGDDHVTVDGIPLVGEVTVTGAVWDPAAWVQSSEAGAAWDGDDAWSGSSWSGSSWSGSSWSGSSWSGSSWSGSSWSGSSWSGSSWSGSSWSGSSWSGSSWSGAEWA